MSLAVCCSLQIKFLFANMTRLLAKISPSLSFSMAMGPGNPLLKYNAKGAQETPLLKYNAKGAVSRNWQHLITREILYCNIIRLSCAVECHWGARKENTTRVVSFAKILRDNWQSGINKTFFYCFQNMYAFGRDQSGSNIFVGGSGSHVAETCRPAA